MNRQTRIIMGMPITVEIADRVAPDIPETVFDHLRQVDERFSPFRPDSELSRYDRGEIPHGTLSCAMREVLKLAATTEDETGGYFSIRRPDGRLDPSGIVKGWAISGAARKLLDATVRNFYLEAGGDIQTAGKNGGGQGWRVGIRNPFDEAEVIKVVALSDAGIATSGSYARGDHIYNPLRPKDPIDSIVSLTVVAGDVLEADRFATAAFAMGDDGIGFIEERRGLEGYMIDANGVATLTSGFKVFALS